MLRGELCYLGGRPGVAKTALALQWALLAAGKTFPVLVVSREMKNLALGQRVIAQQAMVSATGLRKRELYYEERRRLERALPRLRDLPVWFDDEASTIRQIRRDVHVLRPRLLVVDYVQLVRAPEASRKGDRRLEVTAVSAALKDLTMRYGLSVLALSSLRRLQPEKGVRGQPKRRPAPTLDDLKESGDLEADADMVILLHQPDPNSTDRELLFEKLRNGQGGGSVTLAWHPAYVRFMEVDGAEPSAAALADPDNPLSEVPF
jgi:replicative DNA helicase